MPGQPDSLLADVRITGAKGDAKRLADRARPALRESRGHEPWPGGWRIASPVSRSGSTAAGILALDQQALGRVAAPAVGVRQHGHEPGDVRLSRAGRRRRGLSWVTRGAIRQIRPRSWPSRKSTTGARPRGRRPDARPRPGRSRRDRGRRRVRWRGSRAGTRDATTRGTRGPARPAGRRTSGRRGRGVGDGRRLSVTRRRRRDHDKHRPAGRRGKSSGRRSR